MKNIYYPLCCILLFTACDNEDSDEDPTTDDGTFVLTSAAVANGELLEAFKCESKTNDIENSIPLAWENVPEGTASLAVMMYHFPNADDETQSNSYILLWDIDPSVTAIPYGTADDGAWYMGANKDGNTVSYTSPCSPSAGSHEYTITVYALSETPASLPSESTIAVDYETLKTAIESVTRIGSASLTFNDVNE